MCETQGAEIGFVDWINRVTYCSASGTNRPRVGTCHVITIRNAKISDATATIVTERFNPAVLTVGPPPKPHQTPKTNKNCLRMD